MVRFLRWSRKQRYNLAAILEILNNRQHHARIILEDQVYEDRWTMVVITNTIHAGNGMKMAPSAKIDDGLLDVLLVRRMGRIKLLRTFAKLFSGTHLPDPDIIHQRVRNFQLETTTRLPLIVDGETIGSSPFSVRVLPQRIRIFH